jgi:hypothetical protein
MKSESRARAFTRKLVLGAALAVPAGCAHGWSLEAGARDLRGSTELRGAARVLVDGPALSVHADAEGGEPIALYVVDRVNGDDRDCARAPDASAAQPALDAGRHVEVGQGRELCAVASPAGRLEVHWHARMAAPLKLVAKK